MRRNFLSSGLNVNLSRFGKDSQLTLNINSDCSYSNHKGKINPKKEVLATEVENLWKSIKTKKLLSLQTWFDEIDWYDDMTDVYTTPVVKIERGLKKARLSEQEHDNIPKDWGFNVEARIADTTTSTPILEVVKKSLGSYFTPAMEKEFLKVLKPVLQKKQPYCSVSSER